MKKYVACYGILGLLLCSFAGRSQTILDLTDTVAGPADPQSVGVNYELGKGLQIALNNGKYAFNIGGFIRPYAQFQRNDLLDSSGLVNNFGLGSARIYFTGSAAQEKLSFRVDLDLASANALKEAWLAFTPTQYLKITVGQKLVFANNREYYAQENNLQFTNRSALSNYFTNEGRELGVFVESKFNLGQVQIKPAAAITSGDGINSFGNNSADPDAGGLKYMGRLDILPFGAFTNNGDYYGADIEREQKPKLAIGAALSRNVGASGSTGEQHNAFSLYQSDGTAALANYDKLFVDLIFKYKGFSVMAEFANARAQTDKFLFLEATTATAFRGDAIARRYIVGNAWNVQAGYVTKANIGIDLRYTKINPEFNSASGLLQEQTWYTVGATRYFKGQALKLSADYSHVQQKSGGTETPANIVRLMAQIVL